MGSVYRNDAFSNRTLSFIEHPFRANPMATWASSLYGLPNNTRLFRSVMKRLLASSLTKMLLIINLVNSYGLKFEF